MADQVMQKQPWLDLRGREPGKVVLVAVSVTIAAMVLLMLVTAFGVLELMKLTRTCSW